MNRKASGREPNPIAALAIGDDKNTPTWRDAVSLPSEEGVRFSSEQVVIAGEPLVPKL